MGQGLSTDQTDNMIVTYQWHNRTFKRSEVTDGNKASFQIIQETGRAKVYSFIYLQESFWSLNWWVPWRIIMATEEYFRKIIVSNDPLLDLY